LITRGKCYHSSQCSYQMNLRMLHNLNCILSIHSMNYPYKTHQRTLSNLAVKYQCTSSTKDGIVCKCSFRYSRNISESASNQGCTYLYADNTMHCKLCNSMDRSNSDILLGKINISSLAQNHLRPSNTRPRSLNRMSLKCRIHISTSSSSTWTQKGIHSCHNSPRSFL